MTNLELDVLVAKGKDLAMKHYEKGMDDFIECWGRDEWVEFIKEEDFKGWAEMKADMLQQAHFRMEKRADVRGWGDCDAEEAIKPWQDEEPYISY
jgi:hypothetical protein